MVKPGRESAELTLVALTLLFERSTINMSYYCIMMYQAVNECFRKISIAALTALLMF